MNVTVAIANDYTGLKRAALEMLEEELTSEQRDRTVRLAAMAANAEQMLAAGALDRTMADGYYLRVGYLLEVEATIRMGLRFDAGEMRLNKIRGLFAIEAARTEFERLHPRCRGCGARLDGPEEKICGPCEAAMRKNRA